MLTRAQRVKRGFNRLAIVSASIAGALSLLGAVNWAYAPYANLSIWTGDVWAEMSPSLDDATIDAKLIEQYGLKKPSYSDTLLASQGQTVVVNYLSAIRDARSSHAHKSSTGSELFLYSLLIGAIWCGFLLVISWLIRGFMQS